ncbi:MAG: hypothetical protein ACYDIA_05745 [Candidatus Humimicrobiaceae bacterium]
MTATSFTALIIVNIISDHPRIIAWSDSITFDLPCLKDQIFCCMPAVRRPINRLVIKMLASAIKKERNSAGRALPRLEFQCLKS